MSDGNGNGPSPKSALGGHELGYGVLKGNAFWQGRTSSKSSHRAIGLLGDTTNFSILIGVEGSRVEQLQHLHTKNIKGINLRFLEELQQGFTKLDAQPGAGALDYVKGDLFEVGDRAKFQAQGVKEALAHIMDRPPQDRPRFYAFGTTFGTPSHVAGINNIHMNQGSKGEFKSTNGTWQDGALLFHYYQDNHWEALFLKFESQTFDTDATGNPNMAP